MFMQTAWYLQLGIVKFKSTLWNLSLMQKNTSVNGCDLIALPYKAHNERRPVEIYDRQNDRFLQLGVHKSR